MLILTGQSLVGRTATALLIFGLTLAACAGRSGPKVLQSVSTRGAHTKHVTVFAATTRVRENPAQNIFTAGRSEKLHFASFDIFIPPSHRPSNVQWAHGKPDAWTDLVVADQNILSQESFARDIRARADHRSIGVFVHGYNYTFQEALFRLAQMAVDANIASVPVLFSWPSQGTVTGYVADRESVMFSRDYLTALLV